MLNFSYALATMTLPVMVLLIGILLTFNYFVVSIARGIFRWQHINRHHYDYYDRSSLTRSGQFWHCFQLEVFRGPTILLSVAICGLELSAFYWLLLS